MISMTAPQYRRHECTVDGRRVWLKGPWGIELVALLLVSNPSRCWTINELIEATWPNPDSEPDCAKNIIEVRIFRLRMKGIPIENRWGLGWRIPARARAEKCGEKVNFLPARLAA